MRNYRYLGQVATAIAFADFEVEKRYKKLLRDHSHFVPAVFEIASHFISFLGLFEFTSCHIRRNDFQFKNSWVPPRKSFERMAPLFDAARPKRMGSLPVNSAARLGVQIACAEYHCVKRAPSAAILLIAGVCVLGAPYT